MKSISEKTLRTELSFRGRRTSGLLHGGASGLRYLHFHGQICQYMEKTLMTHGNTWYLQIPSKRGSLAKYHVRMYFFIFKYRT